jgi:hypothetical protein
VTHPPQDHLGYQFVVPLPDAPGFYGVYPNVTFDAPSHSDIRRYHMQLSMFAEQVLTAHYLRIYHPHPGHNYLPNMSIAYHI